MDGCAGVKFDLDHNWRVLIQLEIAVGMRPTANEFFVVGGFDVRVVVDTTCEPSGGTKGDGAQKGTGVIFGLEQTKGDPSCPS